MTPSKGPISVLCPFCDEKMDVVSYEYDPHCVYQEAVFSCDHCYMRVLMMWALYTKSDESGIIDVEPDTKLIE